MLEYCVAYATTAVFFLIFNLLWLSWAAGSFYRVSIGGLMAERVNVPAAISFYVFYILGILIFAVIPALEADSLRTAMISGLLFGFFAYATYDLTNLATLRGWPVAVSAVDIAIGTLVTGLSASVGFMIASNVTGWL